MSSFRVLYAMTSKAGSSFYMVDCLVHWHWVTVGIHGHPLLRLNVEPMKEWPCTPFLAKSARWHVGFFCQHLIHCKNKLVVLTKKGYPGCVLEYFASAGKWRKVVCFEAKEKKVKSRQSPQIKPRAPGLSCQCYGHWATPPGNHQCSQSSILLHRWYWMLQSHTWQPLIMCRQNSVRGWLENSLHQKRTHAECFT